MTPAIERVIEQLAAKLGVAAEVLWAALLRQAPLAGISELAILVLAGAAVYAMTRFTMLTYRRVHVDRDWDDVAWIPVGVVIFFVGLVALLVLGRLDVLLAAFFNPEYWALMKILKSW